jgi:L-fuconolactonase
VRGSAILQTILSVTKASLPTPAYSFIISEPSKFMRLDSHQHFWHYNPTELIWMTSQMQALMRDFLPSDLKPLLDALQFDGCILVQARQTLEETRWLLELAEQYPFIKGVVGWVDLRSDRLTEQLQRFARNPKLVGVRHAVHDEPDDNFMLLPEFRRGIAQLRDFNLTYDLLLFPKHLPVAAQLVREFPQQPFVLDHIAKPKIAQQLISPWKEDLHQLATFPNVFCKLSGMVTETNWKQWRPVDFHPYLDIVLEAFGPSRLMIGSDWPVCILSAEYVPMMKIVMDYIPTESQNAILGDNCARFYRIPAEEQR